MCWATSPVKHVERGVLQLLCSFAATQISFSVIPQWCLQPVMIQQKMLQTVRQVSAHHVTSGLFNQVVAAWSPPSH